MAKNWSMKDAIAAVQSGNKEDIMDIGRRFPLTLCALSAVGDNVGAKTIIEAIPEYITVRKIEAILKDGVNESSDEDDEITEPKEMKVEKTVVEEPEDKPKRGRKKKVTDPREEMSEVELFKLCKSNGIKAKPKQDKKYYIDLLDQAEAEAENDEEDEIVEEKPVKKDKKKKEVPMNPPEDEDEDDDDDDWDI